MYRLFYGMKDGRKRKLYAKEKGAYEQCCRQCFLSSRMLFRSYMFCYATKKQEYSEKGRIWRIMSVTQYWDIYFVMLGYGKKWRKSERKWFPRKKGRKLEIISSDCLKMQVSSKPGRLSHSELVKPTFWKPWKITEDYIDFKFSRRLPVFRVNSQFLPL